MTAVFICLALIIGLFLLFLLIVSPSDRKHKNIALLKGAYIAHRGLHDIKKGVPENTLPAFQKALEKGYPIEIDIHLTCDGKVVVFHDHKLRRLCDETGIVEEKTLEELKTYSVLGTKERIPTLEEVLDLVNGKVFLLIEFKMKNNTKELCLAANAILSRYHGVYFIQSFYPQVLRWYKWHQRKVCRGLLAARFPEKKWWERLPGKMLLNFMAKPDFIAYRHQDSRSVMRRFAVWLGAESLGWTFQSQKELNEKREDFNGYIFENFIPKAQ